MLQQLERFGIDKVILTIDSDTEIPQEMKNRWLSFGKTRIVDVSDKMDRIGITEKIDDRLSKFTFLRLAIPYLKEFRDYDSVLYLDTDILILKDFTGIFDIQLGDCDFGCAIDYVVEHGFLKGYAQKLKSKYKDLYGIENLNGDHYFNAGVTLFNVEKIARNLDKYTETLRRLHGIYYKDPYEYCDQGTINLGFKIKEIPQIYNKTYHFSPKGSDDVFLHFTTNNKEKFDEIVEKYGKTV